MVDPREVEQVQRAPHPLHPPAVAAALQRRPVIQRVAPQLAVAGVRVGRGAGDQPGLEQLGVEAVVAAAGRDVDGDVAEDPHAALGGVGAQRAPLAVEAHLVGDGAAPGEPLPVADPDTRGARGTSAISAADTAARGSASRPRQAANAELDLYGER